MSLLVPGPRTIFSAGESIYSDISSNLKHLNGTCAATKFTTLRYDSGTSGYAVTSGKTLFLLSFMIVGSGSDTLFVIGYGDTDVGVNAAGAPTNALPLNGQFRSIANTNTELPIFFSVPATKYVYFNAGSQDAYIHMWGYEK